MTTAQIIVLALIAVFALLSMASMLTRPRSDEGTVIQTVSAALITAKETGRVVSIRVRRDGVEIYIGASEDDDEPVQDGD